MPSSQISDVDSAIFATTVAGRRPTHVVGVGASAGGLEALERMFLNVPPESGMAFVVVQHLSPDFRSLMDELLARWTSMPIFRVEDGMRVEANAIYLLPPRKEMIIADGRLLLADKEPDQGLSLPIDHFLRSLAQDCGRTAIAVILSGTGSDGSRGIEDIKQAGGMVIAQTARTAKFDGMPNAARETGLVDISLDPDEIGDALVRYATSEDLRHWTAELSGTTVDEDGLSAIFRQLRDRYGLDFSYYKLNTIVRRTERRLQLAHIDSVQEYAQLIAKDPEELDALYRDLLVGVTCFFRDPDAYAALQIHIDQLLERKEPDTEFRAWVAGCATGEEAYSLAILLHERIRACGKPIAVRVFATDVHRRSLETASEATYTSNSLTEIPADRRMAWFAAVDGKFALNQELRQSVVFAPHNVIKDAPFTRMDLISCRNLLIYLQPQAQKKAISLFHFGLRTGAVLFLGPSETPAELDDEFETLDGHWKIYRKRRDIRLPIELRAPVGHASRSVRASGLPEIPSGNTKSNDAYLLGTYDALLAEFMPPALLISEQHELLHVFGDAGRLLKHRQGRAGKDVLDLLDSKLRLAIVGAIQQVHGKRKSEVNFRGIRVETETGEERLAVTVRPVTNQRTQASDLLVILQSMGEPTTVRAGDTELPGDFGSASAEQLSAIESELRYTRENLQATIEELETSNEELQATNEELVASNEELQSTNEELQSVNEELYTVNAEHQRKILELTVMTDDMDNLLASTRVHTIFLDCELRIRKFTPQVAEIFNFVPSDVGRPFDNFSHRLRRTQLAEELAQVLRTGTSIETDVQDNSGHWYLMRILPYRAKSAMTGVLLTLIDIEALKHTQQELARREFELRMIADHVPALISCVDRNLTYRYVNRRYSEIFGQPQRHFLGRSMHDVLGQEMFAEVLPFVEQVLAGTAVEFETYYRLPHARNFWATVSYIPDLDEASGQVRGFFICKHDISALKEIEQRFARAVSGTTDGIWDWNVRTGKVYYSPRFAELLGFDSADTEFVKTDVDSRIHPDDFPVVHTAEQALLRDGVPFDVEYRMQCRDGRYCWFRGRAGAQRDPAGRPIYVSGSIQNIEAYRALVGEKARQVEQRDRFLAMLSHELRNPLGAVVNGCRILKTQGFLPANTTAVVDAMTRQSQQMTALLEDLLDVARITEGKIDLQKQLVDLRDVFGPAIESVQPQFDVRRQQVVQQMPDHPVGVHGNLVRLRQIVSNLLSNASKYSPSGSTVRVLLDCWNGHANLKVIDEGDGIPPELLQRIFEPFEQLGKRIDRTDGGVGLGLTVAQQLVRMHDGTIEARSDGPGQGTEFIVRLPTVPWQSPATMPPKLDSSNNRGMRIVLLEDNLDAQELLTMLLRQDGFQVSTAASGIEGLTLIRETRPDAAIIDIGMPEMDGYAVARAVRSIPELQSTFLIALTGYGQAADRLEAIDSGFDTHFTKPIDIQQLEQRLRQIGKDGVGT